MLKTGQVLESSRSTAVSKPVEPSWERFLAFHDTTIANHKKLVADKAMVIARIEQLAKLAADSAEIPESQLSKLDEAEKSIRLKKSKQAIGKYYEERTKLLDKYGFPFENLLDNAAEIAEAQRKKGGTKNATNFGTPWVLEKAFAEIEDIERANYKGSQSDKGPFLRPSCLDTDKRLSKNCIKPWINACSKTYRSEEKMLYLEGITREWTISRFNVSGPHQYPSFMLESSEMDEQTKDTVINKWGFGLTYNACGWLSRQGFDFGYTGTLYPIFDINAAVEEYENIRQNENFNADTFHKVCSPKPDYAINNISTLSSNSRIWPEFKSMAPALKQTIQGCKKAVQNMCAEVGRPYDKFAVYYATKGCDVRAVTKDDIESDLKSWADNEYITEATRQDHLSLKHRVEICEAASAVGYSWNFTVPKPDKECKKSNSDQ
jgi:hypothetical protein